MWDSKMGKRLILEKGFRKLSDDIIEHSENLSATQNDIFMWAKESNQLNCEFVFNTDGHPDVYEWEAALINTLAKGTKRVARLIEEFLA